MSDKVISETPVSEAISDVLDSPTPEATPGNEAISQRDAAREAIENKVSEVNQAPKVEEAVVDDAKLPIVDESLKARIQKRIDKEVAKRKTAEEELAELRSENERLRAAQNPNTVVSPTNTNAEPTIEQCEAYIIKCREEGDTKNEIAAMRYLVQLEKEAALKAFKSEQEAEAKKAQAIATKQQTDWIALNRDYESDNPEINLANQNGLLYKEAMKLYKDPDLRQVYNDPDRIMGFRKAVHDAHRYIVENGLHKRTPSEVIDTTLRPVFRKPVLADPGSEAVEETVTSPQNLSDADKVKEEIMNRRRNLYSR